MKSNTSSEGDMKDQLIICITFDDLYPGCVRVIRSGKLPHTFSPPLSHDPCGSKCPYFSRVVSSVPWFDKSGPTGGVSRVEDPDIVQINALEEKVLGGLIRGLMVVVMVMAVADVFMLATWHNEKVTGVERKEKRRVKERGWVVPQEKDQKRR